MMTMEIKRADISNLQVLVDLSVATFCEAFAAVNRKEDMDKYVATELSEDKLREELADRRNCFFMAWEADIAIGYAKMRAFVRPPELQHDNPVEIERIYVRESHYGQGVGAALMKYCISYATSHHHNPVWLGVWEHNEKAISFYKAWGFELFGAHIFRLGDDDQTDILMKKYIAQ